MLRKNPKFDIKLKYRKVFEVSIALALFLTIVAFKTFPNLKIEKNIEVVPQVLLSIVEIPPTGVPLPPPPPVPPIPVEAPDDLDDLSDIAIDENILNINDNVAPPLPPELPDESPIDYDFVPVAEIMPTPIGGISTIQKKIIYPEIAKRAGVQGRVFIRAFVGKNGNVIRAEIIKGIGAGCDEAAIAAVLKTKFSPGMQRGKPVRVQVSIPIYFKLN